MKYVVVRAEDGLEVIVVFSPMLSHRDVVDALALAPKTMHFKPVSAGVVKCDGSAKCLGYSQSLGLASRPERDTRVLRIAVAASSLTAGGAVDDRAYFSSD